MRPDAKASGYRDAVVREDIRRVGESEVPQWGVEVVWFGSMADDGQGGKKSGTVHDLVKAESMMQLALVLPAACVIGALAGSALDKHFHTGWMVVAGILLGAVAGFIQIFKTASRYMKRDR
ncbi:MAG: AtpZ/AtpI family protein [Acidobacteriaceae bacterium]